MIRSRRRWSRPEPWPWLVLALAFAVMAALAVPMAGRWGFGEGSEAGHLATLQEASRSAESARDATLAAIEEARAITRGALTAAGRVNQPTALAGTGDADAVVTLRRAAAAEPAGPAARLDASPAGAPRLLVELPLDRDGRAWVATIRATMPTLAAPHLQAGLLDATTRFSLPYGGVRPEPRIAEAILAAIAADPGTPPHVALPPRNGAEPLVVAWTAVPGTRLLAFAAVSPAPPAGQSTLLWFLVCLLAGAGALVFLLLHGNRERRRLADDLARARQNHDAAIRALSQRQNLETLGRLTAGVAHDMGNVMQTVELYLRSIPGSLDDREATLRLIERARGAARRGAVGARDLLALARGSAQPPEAIDLRPLLTELSEVMEELLGEQFTVRLNLPIALPRVLADSGDLEAMLINLATNARDAMAEAGRGDLGISATLIGSPDAPDARPEVTGGEWVRIDITDTGVGMAPEVLERAMEPFFTTKPRGRGTGLGLALAREFAERSGGMLRIESVPGSGTRTSIFLHPASESGPEPATGENLTPGDRDAGLTGPEPTGSVHAPG